MKTESILPVFGMIRVTMGDHAAAAYLRKHSAINNFRVMSTHTEWWAPATGTGKAGFPARVVLLCTYHGIGGMDVHQWIPADLGE